MAKRYNIVLKMELNALARALYAQMGYIVSEGYDFSKAKHPQEKLCWAQAELSYEFWCDRLKGRG